VAAQPDLCPAPRRRGQHLRYVPAGEDGKVWVGAPLRVHRRCAEPMFTISNAIAYGGLMVYGTAEREPLSARESVWIHVPRAGSEGHWIPREGDQVRKILTALLHRYGLEPEQVFVPTPFRDVADHIRQLRREFPGLRGGTVHTAQGKEAEIVVLILGGDPGKPGARQWASQRPNLLNVAVSRARQRPYVIGDQTSWARYRHFSELAKNLPLWPPQGGAG
jgi:superfamily I DNA and/or RNA helicase